MFTSGKSDLSDDDDDDDDVLVNDDGNRLKCKFIF